MIYCYINISNIAQITTNLPKLCGWIIDKNKKTGPNATLKYLDRIGVGEEEKRIRTSLFSLFGASSQLRDDQSEEETQQFLISNCSKDSGI